MKVKLLIANRGEIALRIIRTCRKLGIRTVAVYSDVDQESLPVAYADQRYPLHGITPSETYLSIPKIVQAALDTGCDGVHPGYGFLSEDSDFVEACREKNLVFVGPNPKAITKIGNKLAARKTMHEAGVPLIPGTDEPLKNEYEALEIAKSVGYPVILKAVYGGGGRGMRIAKSDDEVRRFYRVTKLEAASSFGRDLIYMEKRLTNPRHVEIQALANSGNVISLGERECSIQRRYQKLVEEAPSVAVNDELRGRLNDATKNGLGAAEYTNAGTVEFLIDQENKFYFLEVNKRLQVEHVVTELTTGIDIVEEQLRIAFESELNLSQNEVHVTGWAINGRINAEDPRKDFSPSPGTVIHFHAPSGPGIRVDSALYSGYIIPEYYDSLIAKLSAWGRDRTEAIRRLQNALEEVEIIGVPTTIPLYRALLRDQAFINGQFDTTYLNTFVKNMNTELLELELCAAAIAAAMRATNLPFRNRLQQRFQRSYWKASARATTQRRSM
ncbi:MAG TPA: acetyl-CoA carboxylase biotin carboxylase subunit [Candidatus Saccharimonadales bacterium]|nr:acetyl-CoA carboxylase biotin carboxylase subunit [Candidatus Saccharimonadales bacterium]